MARMYQARCLTDTVMGDPYQYFKAGEVYTVCEDWPVLKHFERIGAELPQKEAERIEEEGFPTPQPAEPHPLINRNPEGKLKPPPKGWQRP